MLFVVSIEQNFVPRQGSTAMFLPPTHPSPKYNSHIISEFMFKLLGILLIEFAIAVVAKSKDAIYLSWMGCKWRIKINSLTPFHDSLHAAHAVSSTTQLKAQYKLPSMDCRSHLYYSPRQHCSTAYCFHTRILPSSNSRTCSQDKYILGM